MTFRDMLARITADNDQDQAECDAWMRETSDAGKLAVWLRHSKAYEVAQQMAETFAEYLRAEEDTCRIDHNGFCQSHTSKAPCIVAEARALLERWEEVTG